MHEDAFGNALGSSLAEANSGELSLSERRNLDYDDPKMVAYRAQNPLARSTYQSDPIATITSDEIATWHGTNLQELFDGLPAVKFAPRTYTVQRGDNPASIGNQFFGDERAGAAILAENGLPASVRGARGLQVGKVLTIPDDISDANMRAGGRLIGINNAVSAQEAQQREAALRDKLYNDPDSFRFKSMRDRAASDAAEMAALLREAEIARANGPQLREWDGVLREDPGTAYLRKTGALDVRGSSFHYQQSQSLSEALVNEAGGVVLNTGLKLLNPSLQMLKGAVLSEQTLLRMELNGAMQSGLNADLRTSAAMNGLDANASKGGINIEALKEVEINGTSAKRILEGTNGEIAIIGRSMHGPEGVVDYAVELNKRGYKTHLFAGDEISAECRTGSGLTFDIVQNGVSRTGSQQNGVRPYI